MTHETQLEVKREKLLDYWHAVRAYQRMGVSLKDSRRLVALDIEEENLIHDVQPLEVPDVQPSPV